MKTWVFHPYHKRKVQGLTIAQIIERLQSGKKLLNQQGSKRVDRIIFSDENLFCIYQVIIVKIMMFIQEPSMI